MVSGRYGGEHQALRRRLLKTVEGTACVRCGRPLQAGDPVDLDHTDDGTGYLGLACASCNRRAGGLKGGTQRWKRRRPVELRSRCAGVDVARDRTRTALVVAGFADHPTGGEVIAAQLHLFDGVATLTAVTAVLGDGHVPVAVNGLGHMRALAEQLHTEYAVAEAKAQDIVDANARLLDVLRDRRLKILQPHPELTAAVQHAKVRPLVEGQALDKRRAERDLAPLAALELAVWCLLNQPPDYDVLDSIG